MKNTIQTLAKLIGSSFYLIEFLLIFFPLYYFFMLFFYLIIFLFDEGLISLTKWEENRYAKITTQAFDSVLHLYYYFFYIISIFVGAIHVLMSGLGNYLVSKIYKDSEDNLTVDPMKKDLPNGVQHIHHGRKRKAFKNLLIYAFMAFLLGFSNIYGNFIIREYYPHTVLIELYFMALAWVYSRVIYINVYSYKHSKHQDEQDFIGVPMGYGIMKSVFWGYILFFELV